VVAESPVPVICFSGAPFTLASYMIEGRPSRGFDKVKAFMYREPHAFDLLLRKLACVMSGYLEAQVAAGAQAVQLFDSWVGTLTLEDYEARVAPHTRSIFDALSSSRVPRIHFGTDTAHLLQAIARTGPDVISIDWRVHLDEAWPKIGDKRGVQGNLEPALLLGPAELVRERARDVLRRAAGRPGHIFNLGHGVPPGSSVENLQLLVDTVHSWVPDRVA
jgi:uroporphyrinogen decarboxylase